MRLRYIYCGVGVCFRDLNSGFRFDGGDCNGGFRVRFRLFRVRLSDDNGGFRFRGDGF